MSELQHQKLDELIEAAKPTMHKMLDQALASGALSEEYKEDSYLLAKTIITIWGRQGNYEHPNKARRKEVANLEKFL